MTPNKNNHCKHHKKTLGFECGHHITGYVSKASKLALIITVLVVSALLATESPVHSSVPSTGFTQAELAWIKAHPKVRVHNELDWAPININTSGIPKGFSVDYFRLVAQKTGLEIELISGPSWNEFTDMMKKGTLDVMLNIARTPERDKYLTFSDPYIEMIQTLYARQNFPLV